MYIRAYKRGANKKFKYVKSFRGSYGLPAVTYRTPYSAKVKLTSRGDWKLVAVHDEDEGGTAARGTADYVTVK